MALSISRAVRHAAGPAMHAAAAVEVGAGARLNLLPRLPAAGASTVALRGERRL
jgi:hypothetical protein